MPTIAPTTTAAEKRELFLEVFLIKRVDKIGTLAGITDPVLAEIVAKGAKAYAAIQANMEEWARPAAPAP